jgi:hypothetical protein
MASNASGHHPDKAPGKVAIDEDLWGQCQAFLQGLRERHFLKVDGCTVHVVDANKVMVHHDMDFCQGGNGLEDPKLCKRDELCLDDRVRPDDWPFILYHEAIERRMMLKGWSYARAHNLANDHERELRRRSLGNARPNQRVPGAGPGPGAGANNGQAAGGGLLNRAG